ncbi:dual specificity protein phosphatase 12-like isoform X2 [Impatiens glandulifera]|nr:dual specificity protein phosphatase 12-like isoform X2 [Impatiens glandulifera]
MPYLVRENLFIGDIASAADVLQNASSEITHILSVVSSASISFFSEWRSEISITVKEICKVSVRDFESEDSSGDGGGDKRTSLSPDKLLYAMEYAGKDLKIVRMAVPLRDTENENLLDYLNVCLDFIDKSRKEGSVLVHCFAGVSRSAAIMTAYLMRTEQLSQEDALESLRQSCEFVCPNDGFLDQLKMFEEMNFKVDHSSLIYKRFRLKVLGDSYNRGEIIDSSKFGADPGISLAKTNVSASSEIESSSTSVVDKNLYRCKKCRRLVALQENVVGHVPGEGQNSFGWRKKRHANPLSKPEEFECSSVFVEPLRWMKLVEEGALEGKLFCNHCEARLGCFNWSGIQCSCGSWITPAFQLHKSKVDISRV